jgi:hypothetical protein
MWIIVQLFQEILMIAFSAAMFLVFCAVGYLIVVEIIGGLFKSIARFLLRNEKPLDPKQTNS